MRIEKCLMALMISFGLGGGVLYADPCDSPYDAAAISFWTCYAQGGTCDSCMDTCLADCKSMPEQCPEWGDLEVGYCRMTCVNEHIYCDNPDSKMVDSREAIKNHDSKLVEEKIGRTASDCEFLALNAIDKIEDNSEASKSEKRKWIFEAISGINEIIHTLGLPKEASKCSEQSDILVQLLHQVG